MATISATLAGNGTHTSVTNNKYAKVVEQEIDFAAAATTKGSALAANDVIEAVNIPAKSFVMGGGIEVVEAMTGTSTDLTLDVGITGGDIDVFVDGYDYDGGAVGDVVGSGVQGETLVAAADTVDILIATQTGTFTGGKIRVWVVLADVSERGQGGTVGI